MDMYTFIMTSIILILLLYILSSLSISYMYNDTISLFEKFKDENNNHKGFNNLQINPRIKTKKLTKYEELCMNYILYTRFVKTYEYGVNNFLSNDVKYYPTNKKGVFSKQYILNRLKYHRNNRPFPYYKIYHIYSIDEENVVIILSHNKESQNNDRFMFYHFTVNKIGKIESYHKLYSNNFY